ncbi:MAG: DEAD/DEAH box helicase [Chloroflexi bacterium]|nr:DEAD/DEAH box helicase [Chloroflexota bacterium]
MERSLDLDSIRDALGEVATLPTPEELREALAKAEIELLEGGTEISDDLLSAAWYLHSIGSAREALNLYPTDRQRRANQVAAHILDLALQARTWTYIEELQLTFAAQVSSLRGDSPPNATALYRRLPRRRTMVSDCPGTVALEIGTAFLALDRKELFDRLQNGIRRELTDLAAFQDKSVRAESSFERLRETVFASAAGVLEATYELLVHLTYNRPESALRARQLLEVAVHPPAARGDFDSRWVAAHLLDLLKDLRRSSIWELVPPGSSPQPALAMTLGEPPVLTFWPPQLDLFSSSPSPLDHQVRRLVLSLPTSAGKTLVAQYIIAAHLARNEGSACVVVPTHSLARELRRDLDRRLRVMAAGATEGGPVGVDLAPSESPRATVMTPEKLNACLHWDSARFLDEYTLFVIDEAHLVGDDGRGWTLESALSFLHYKTQSSRHRIVLLSAAIGNRAHFRAWMSDRTHAASVFHHDWRGPRRVHAIATTCFSDTDSFSFEEARRKGAFPRRMKPVYGQVSIRIGASGGYEHIRTDEPVGTVVWKKPPAKPWQYDSARSTRQYVLRVFAAKLLGAFGSVLVVEGTKRNAQLFAGALAAQLEETSDTQQLVELARSRLGDDHQLVGVLRHGVAFHHAALPVDVQGELEDALRASNLRYLVSTTTLVEGINLPVRSVLVGTRGYPTPDGEKNILDSPKLLNALGRAGRAGKETEGWVVITADEDYSVELFDAFDVDDDDLRVESRLATEEALETLDAFEQLVLQGEDAVFEAVGRAAEGFVSFVWFLASTLGEFRTATSDPIGDALRATLAWQQLDDGLKARWETVCQVTLRAYSRRDPTERHRWAVAGTSLPTALFLAQLAGEIEPFLQELEDPLDPVAVLQAIGADERLRRLIFVSESSHRGFRPRTNSPRKRSVDVDYLAVATDWLEGASLSEIGERHLPDIPRGFRQEQLAEFSTQVLEHVLPWLVDTVISWLNEGRPDDQELCPDLAGFIRFGVSEPAALELMLGGVRSRRLAKAVGDQYSLSTKGLDLRSWLCNMGLPSWRESFRASPVELSDLLTFCKEAEARLVSRALGGERVSVPILLREEPSSTSLDLRELNEPAPSRLGVWDEGRVVACVGEAWQEEVAHLVRLGIPLELDLKPDEELLAIRVRDPETDAAWFSA